MTTCPKCGFKNEQPQATDCPKCGLIYAKYESAKNKENGHISAERALSDSLRKATSYEDASTDFVDFEDEIDSRSYPMVENLHLFFIALSGIVACFTIFEVKYIWSLLDELNKAFKMFSIQDRWLLTLSAGLIGVMQIAIFLAIGGLLRLGKDIADNTRATRKYLLHIAKKTK